MADVSLPKKLERKTESQTDLKSGGVLVSVSLSLRKKCKKSCIKALFSIPVYMLRQGLSRIDECNAHGRYTKPIWVHDKLSESEDEEENSKSKEDDDNISDSDNDNKLYYVLAGHPLSCYDENFKCQSSLIVLRAAATHFPELCKLKRIV